jgi:hypothetical protein
MEEITNQNTYISLSFNSEIDFKQLEIFFEFITEEYGKDKNIILYHSFKSKERAVNYNEKFIADLLSSYFPNQENFYHNPVGMFEKLSKNNGTAYFIGELYQSINAMNELYEAERVLDDNHIRQIILDSKNNEDGDIEDD